VGITSGPEQEIAEVAKKVAKEKYNLEVELVSFNDYVVPNEALNNGDIDANAFQHVPYLTEQSKQRGYKLAVVGNTFVYPIVAYSKKLKASMNFRTEAQLLFRMILPMADVPYFFYRKTVC
jgi:D-methionine transport system substrate-binding protein